MNIGFLSYMAGALAYLVLTILFLTGWRGRWQGTLLILASGLTALWAAALAVQSVYHLLYSSVIWTFEIFRTALWLVFLCKLLSGAGRAQTGSIWPIPYAVYGLSGLLVLLVWCLPFLEDSLPQIVSLNLQIFGHVLLALLGLILIEQLYRNTRPEERWAIKFLCFALGGMFAYDFYLYSDALLFRRINPDIWAARGAVATLLTPLIAVSAARNPNWSLDIFVSRGIVFHSVTLLGAGFYLLFMATAGYYIKIYGGEWGVVAQIVFLVGAFLVLALLLFSGQIRARIRVFLSKHFFNYAYDYRQEWLRIIATLSETHSDMPLAERVVQAIGQLVESPSGILWALDGHGHYAWRASFGKPEIEISRIDANDALVRFIEESAWVINLNEMISTPELYTGLGKPRWLEGYGNAWLFVPLFQGKHLYGLLLLTQPRTPIEWNWEVIDLLKTAGRQAASYLALEDAALKLTEARQFEGFNRLSAFLIHDLKNLIAQLSLIVRNAERHQDNPEFMEDAIRTIDHAVGKMNRLMAQLKNAGDVREKELLELCPLLAEIIAARSKQLPKPRFECTVKKAKVFAERDRLASAFEHVIQNAQEAAGKTGHVSVKLQADGNHALVNIEDDGQGMNTEFIRHRLFKPFETTKGLAGMGIGAYESREYARSLGGELRVWSEPGKGTLFQFVIPLGIQPAKEEQESVEVVA